jgi:hypothetical protein
VFTEGGSAANTRLLRLASAYASSKRRSENLVCRDLESGPIAVFRFSTSSKQAGARLERRRAPVKLCTPLTRTCPFAHDPSDSGAHGLPG